jgi:hypothetical protein
VQRALVVMPKAGAAPLTPPAASAGPTPSPQATK